MKEPKPKVETIINLELDEINTKEKLLEILKKHGHIYNLRDAKFSEKNLKNNS